MRVFVTGASGWIGGAVTAELVGAGHDVVGLARSDDAESRVRALGGRVRRGALDDLDALAAGARDADAVVHLGFNHDFGDFAAAGRLERAAVTALGDALAGSGRPLLIAAGVAGLRRDGDLATETDAPAFTGPDAPRGGSEGLVLEYADRGVAAGSIRFAPSVHGEGDHGFVAELTRVARERGVAGWIGDGAHRWAAVNRADAAVLVRLALERGEPGTIAHAVDDEGVPTREIAEAIGRGLGVPAASIAPEDADAHFGWIGRFFGLDMPASNAATRARFGWSPAGQGLLADLAEDWYFRS